MRGNFRINLVNESDVDGESHQLAERYFTAPYFCAIALAWIGWPV
jgi:hypothetical protein